MLSWNSF